MEVSLLRRGSLLEGWEAFLLPISPIIQGFALDIGVAVDAGPQLAALVKDVVQGVFGYFHDDAKVFSTLWKLLFLVQTSLDHFQMFVP